MNIPESVRINGVDYEIIQESPILMDGVECYGKINFAECTIQLKDKGISEQHKAVTLWHEILHGIIDGSGLELDNKEEIVERLSRGVYQVLQDNGKKLFDLKYNE